MGRFSFQIEPVAEFKCVKGTPSPMKALRAKLAGRMRCEQWTPAAEPVAARTHNRSSVARIAPRPRAPLAAVPLSSVRADPVFLKLSPKAPAMKMAPAPMPAGQGGRREVEYKGHLIAAAQIEDGSWIASHTRIGGEPNAASGASPAERNTYLARFLAIAGAEIEIDELAAA